MNIDIIQVRTGKTMIKEALREKCPNTEFFLVRIWVQALRHIVKDQ